MTADDELRIYQLLGVPPLDLHVTGMKISFSEKTVKFECLYDIVSNRSRVSILFRDCRSMKLEFYREIDNETVQTPIIGVSLGGGDYQGVATITTDHFEVSLLYKEWIIQKGD